MEKQYRIVYETKDEDSIWRRYHMVYGFTSAKDAKDAIESNDTTRVYVESIEEWKVVSVCGAWQREKT